MSESKAIIQPQYIVPVNINGLKGRMLKVPASAKMKREIIFVYGHHASLERVYGFAEFLRRYGNVLVPDLPGFGGMDSYYKIHEKPTLDNLADYLASIVKLRARKRKLTLIGFSFGFTVITRMLQRNPNLAGNADLLVSIGGFSHKSDMRYTLARKQVYSVTTRMLSHKAASIFFRNIALHPYVIKKFYARTYNAKSKLAGLNPEELQNALEFEVGLWRINEPRTHMKTTNIMLNIDNLRPKIDLDLWHVYTNKDRYIDHKIAVNNLKKIFRHVNAVRIKSDNHSPSILATKKEAAVFFPTRLKKTLAKMQT